MRVLFTFVGGHGHLEPLIPVGRAALAAGHTVAFASGAAMEPVVLAAGLSVLAMDAGPSAPPKRLPLLAPDRDREDRQLRERFVERAARHRVPLVLSLCEAWRPDVLVCDETDFGAMVAAERLALPFAVVLVIAAGSFARRQVVGEALDALRAEHGLARDPRLEMRERHLVLSPFPQSFRDPAHPLPANAHFYRPVEILQSTTPAPEWSSVLPGSPTVHLTLGTVFNTESGDLLARLVSSLRALPANLIVTSGPGIEPAELGPQPAHVHVAQFVPQASILPYCDGVVSHGGSGSVIAALAHGLPSLLIPLGADQPHNGDRCADLGVARVLPATALTPNIIRAAVGEMLDDSRMRRNAERIRDEIAALPDVRSVVGPLEALVRR